MLATKEGCYEVLVSIAENYGSEIGVRESALKALSSLLEGNPDPLDESGYSCHLIANYLSHLLNLFSLCFTLDCV